MPVGLEELTRRYQSNILSLQEGLIMMKANMGEQGVFTFDMVKAMDDLPITDLTQERKNVSHSLQFFNEYKRV